jgi:hypothetical protein
MFHKEKARRMGKGFLSLWNDFSHLYMGDLSGTNHIQWISGVGWT